jgi:hypothetical protein
MFDARKAYLKDVIPGPNGPFAKIADWAFKDTKKATEKASQMLQNNLDEMLSKIQRGV